MPARKPGSERAESGATTTVPYSPGYPRNNILYSFSDYTCALGGGE